MALLKISKYICVTCASSQKLYFWSLGTLFGIPPNWPRVNITQKFNQIFLVSHGFFKCRTANKKITATICRLRLGHCCIPVFLAKLRIRSTALCECGLDDGDANHIFFSCPKLRYSLYDCIPLEIPRPISFNCLLSFPSSQHIVKLLSRFINRNNIKL